MISSGCSLVSDSGSNSKFRFKFVQTKGICLIWPRGRLFSPSLSCRVQGIGKQCGTISSWHEQTAGRNLVVHRHGTTLRQSFKRYFSLFFSHFDIKAGKSSKDIVGKEAFHSCPLSCPRQIVDGYCILFIATMMTR